MKKRVMSKRKPPKLCRTIKKKAAATKKRAKKIYKATKSVLKHRNRDVVRIPNTFPHKSLIIARAMEEKKLEDREKMLNRQSQIESYETLASQAQQQGQMFQESVSQKTKNGLSNTKYVVPVMDTINTADIVVQVLDARDPQGSRSPELENRIQQKQKKLIFVINKIDLVPSHQFEKWIQYLKNFAPCVGFKAIDKEGGKEKSFWKEEDTNTPKLNNHEIGHQALFDLLKRTANDIKQGRVTVCVVGQPNTGKSSLINTLARNSKATKTAAEIGVTRVVQEVALDRKMRLMDTPGVILESSPDNILLQMRQSADIKTDGDKMKIVKKLFEKCSKEILLKAFKLKSFDGEDSFVDAVASSIGKLTLGGVPKREAGLDHIISCLNKGRISFYTPLPDGLLAQSKNTVAGVAPKPSLDLDSLAKSSQCCPNNDHEQKTEAIKLVKLSDVKEFEFVLPSATSRIRKLINKEKKESIERVPKTEKLRLKKMSKTGIPIKNKKKLEKLERKKRMLHSLENSVAETDWEMF